MNSYRTFTIFLALALATGAVHPIPALSTGHPRDLTYPESVYAPPDPQSFRTVLGNGAIAFISEDHFLPIIDIFMYVRAGSAYDSRESPGACELTGRGLPAGGTAHLPGSKFQDALDQLGMEMQIEFEQTQTQFRFSGLSRDVSKMLDFIRDLLISPAFDPGGIDRLKKIMEQEIQDSRQEPEEACEKIFQKLLYGDGHPLALHPSETSIQAITPKDLIACHRAFYSPSNTVFAVSGDFNRAEFISRLDASLANWAGDSINLQEIRIDQPAHPPGIYIQPMQLSQGYIQLGHFGITPDNPDYAAVEILSFIIGSGSFTSRLMSRVRSDEGLAYSVDAGFETEGSHRGVFEVATQTKSESVPYALSLIMDELQRASKALPTEDEMKTAVNGMKESLPGNFSTNLDSMCTFAQLELLGRPLDFYTQLNRRYGQLTAEDILDAAKKYIHPENLVILVLGDPEAIRKGDGLHPARLEDFGQVTVLP